MQQILARKLVCCASWKYLHFYPENKYSECINAFVCHPACVM